MKMLLLVFLCVSALGIPKKFDRFYISSSPTESELADFKKQMGAMVIDLRSMDELGNCSEPATVSKLGMQYGRVLFEKKTEIDPKVIEDIDKQVDQSNDKPVLLFCKSGSRASAWLAIHLVKHKNKPVEEAITIAKTTGLKPEMEEAVRNYLKKN